MTFGEVFSLQVPFSGLRADTGGHEIEADRRTPACVLRTAAEYPANEDSNEPTHRNQRKPSDGRALERVKDRFLSNLSHEMRSPLTGIVGAASCLRDYRGAS